VGQFGSCTVISASSLPSLALPEPKTTDAIAVPQLSYQPPNSCTVWFLLRTDSQFDPARFTLKTGISDKAAVLRCCGVASVQ
jgi:hypothetical protein